MNIKEKKQLTWTAVIGAILVSLVIKKGLSQVSDALKHDKQLCYEACNKHIGSDGSCSCPGMPIDIGDL